MVNTGLNPAWMPYDYCTDKIMIVCDDLLDTILNANNFNFGAPQKFLP